MRRVAAARGDPVVARRRKGGNKRALPRIDLEVKVDAASDSGGAHTGSTINISAGGVFVAMEPPISLGEQLKLELTLPDSKRPISLDSKVRWVRRRRVAGRRDRPAGMGLQFVNLTTETSSVIGSFLQAHLSPFAGRARTRS
jgi:uncharacterized protein (TIGR02266 family)